MPSHILSVESDDIVATQPDRALIVCILRTNFILRGPLVPSTEDD